MKFRQIHILLFLIILPCLPGYGQNDDRLPAAPTLLLVTINQDNGHTELSWVPNTGIEFHGYIIFKISNNEGNPIDTILDPSATSFSFPNPRYKVRSECYAISAVDTTTRTTDTWRESKFSNNICTIYATASPDPCNNLIKLSWNEYSSYPHEVSRYEIIVSEDGGPFFLAGQVESEETAFSFQNITEGSRYDFIIKAVLENGQSSSSNPTSAVASLTTLPRWINADYATVTDDGEIELSFHIDSSSDIDTFALERRTGYSGPYQQIELFTGGDTESLSYTDRSARTDEINFYRLSAVVCREYALTSNTASSLKLSLTNTGNEIILNWNRYRQWLGSVSSWTILADKGKGFEYEATVSPDDTLYVISIPEIMHELKKDELCFKIRATETGNPHGINGESVSGNACTTIEELVTLPNVFTPDGDGINDLFRPVMTFTPAEYRLTISDRRRKVVFETSDHTESWDGTSGGSPVAQDVYMWFLRVTTPSGLSIDRTGTITVVRRK
ncbi:MAG: gliding motility-associated C-terminal domain-containing protein [Bacteroidales bacterium]|nr:gliding motility-associated C-terminal domain-containing protein [Bacteroidales bacterium]